jgi:hypothetical protein
MIPRWSPAFRRNLDPLDFLKARLQPHAPGPRLFSAAALKQRDAAVYVIVAKVGDPSASKQHLGYAESWGRFLRAGECPPGVEVVMRSTRCERLMRWGIGALVLLLAHGLAAPRTARAGCNHLVTSQSDRLLDHNRLDDLITGGSSASIAGDPGQDPAGRPGPRRPAPCSGPGCSNGIPWPAPTAPSAPVGPDQWVALSTVLRLAEAAPLRHSPDEPAARPAGHKPSIFHPPPA